MWLEILLFKRYLVGIHYFYIYAKPKSKWHSGKINYSYLLNKWLVTQAQCMILVYTSLLIPYLLKDLWDVIFQIYLSVRRYNLVNSYSTANQWFSKCRCLCHMACVKFTLVVLVCSHCTFLIVRWSYETRVPCRCSWRERCVGWMQIPAVSRESAMLLMQPLIGAAASTQRLLVHNWINNLLHFKQVFNIVISLSSISHYLMFVSLLQFMYIYTKIT